MSSRGILIAGNWKMNHGPRETEQYFATVRARWKSMISAETAKALNDADLKSSLFVPAVSLSAAVKAAEGLPFRIGSENTHWENKGAYTGEISVPMLKEIGVDTSLVGHSERRQLFGETDLTVNKRTNHLIDQNFTVILCVGETLDERKAGRTHEVLYRQLTGALSNQDGSAGQIFERAGDRLVIAYEPVWAIGTGVTASPEQAQEAHEMVRSFIRDRYNDDVASRTPVLYGGSVTPENVDSLLACPDVDGALVGGASLKPESFLTLLEAGGRALTSGKIALSARK